MKKERLEKHTRGKMQGLGRNPSGEDERSREKCLGEKRNVSLLREIGENEI